MFWMRLVVVLQHNGIDSSAVLLNIFQIFFQLLFGLWSMPDLWHSIMVNGELLRCYCCWERESRLLSGMWWFHGQAIHWIPVWKVQSVQRIRGLEEVELVPLIASCRKATRSHKNWFSSLYSRRTITPPSIGQKYPTEDLKNLPNPLPNPWIESYLNQSKTIDLIIVKKVLSDKKRGKGEIHSMENAYGRLTLTKLK